MPYNDSLNQSRATLYGVTRADWNQAMEDTNLLRAAQLGVSVAADGNVTFAARTGSNWTGVGAANAAGDFYSAFAVNAAELIAAGYSKVQVRWRAVTLCTTIMSGSPVNPRLFLGWRRRAIFAAPAAPESSVTAIAGITGVAGLVVTNTGATYSSQDSGWLDLGITQDTIVEWMTRISPDSAGTDNTGSFSTRIAIYLKGV